MTMDDDREARLREQWRVASAHHYRENKEKINAQRRAKYQENLEEERAKNRERMRAQYARNRAYRQNRLKHSVEEKAQREQDS